jgi:hypothetical protein
MGGITMNKAKHIFTTDTQGAMTASLRLIEMSVAFLVVPLPDEIYEIRTKAEPHIKTNIKALNLKTMDIRTNIKSAKDGECYCTCGNRADLDGFYPCNAAGVEVEPTEKDWPDGLYLCERCKAIINGAGDIVRDAPIQNVQQGRATP